MSLPLDFSLLQSDDKFDKLCYRLINKEFPEAVFVASGSWDGGRDILLFNDGLGDVVFQCKYTQQSLSKLKPKITESLNALDSSQKISRWVLCLSVDASGVFLDWLRKEIIKYPSIDKWEVWGKEKLTQRLEQHSDVLDIFFYPIWKALEKQFRTEEIELFRYEIDTDCGWQQFDEETLHFYQKDARTDSDLVLDIIIRSTGAIESLIHSIRLDVFDVKRVLRGLPETALLYSQHTYTLSLKNGKPESQLICLEPPLIVKAGAHQRFKIKLQETGFAWVGYVRLIIIFGNNQELALPCMLLSA
jgi:hypothetical protein